jgi:hypothetical protein
MKQGVLICSPESCGNRLMARLLIGCGYFGHGDVIQRLDQLIPSRQVPANTQKLVWIRSMPHGARHENRHWPYPPILLDQIKQCGFEPRMIVMNRNWHCAAMSQVRNQHVASYEEGIQNIKEAYKHIIDNYSGLNYLMVNYEDLILNGLATFNWVLRWLGQPAVAALPEEIRNGNTKWLQVFMS